MRRINDLYSSLHPQDVLLHIYVCVGEKGFMLKAKQGRKSQKCPDERSSAGTETWWLNMFQQGALLRQRCARVFIPVT